MMPKLEFFRDQGGTYCALVPEGMYQIAGPRSDIARLLGGYSHWLLTKPDGTYDVFYRKYDAMEEAEDHFKKYRRTT